MDILSRDPQLGDFIIVTFSKYVGKIIKITDTQITIVGPHTTNNNIRYYTLNKYSDYIIINDLEEYKNDNLISINEFIEENPNQYISMKDLIIGCKYKSNNDEYTYIGKGTLITKRRSGYTYNAYYMNNKHIFYKESSSWNNNFVCSRRMNRIIDNSDNDARAHVAIDTIVNILTELSTDYNYKFKLQSFDIDMSRGLPI